MKNISDRICRRKLQHTLCAQ